MPGEALFDKLVITTGTTGIGLGWVLERARKVYGDAALYAKFEEYLQDIGKSGVYTIASSLLKTPNSALEIFNRAFEALREDLAREARRGGEGVAFVEAHLSYLSIHTLIPNPMLHRLLSLGREVTIIYYVEDYYHALKRMAERIRRHPRLYEVEGFIVDPLSYMTWRGLDHNLLNMIRASYPHVETLIAGIKHPVETHLRLLRYAGMPRLEGRREYLLAYLSHPISKVREDYAYCRGDFESLAEHPFVHNLERFKDTLIRRCKRLILFEPATIDELVEPRRCDGKREPGSYRIDSRDRWPHARMEDYRSMYPVDVFDREEFGPLYGGSLARVPRPEARTASILDYGPEARDFYLARLRGMIKDQIEIRDFEYVNQASAVIAYEPVYKTLSDGSWHFSQGVRKELARAESQAKAIYVFASSEALPELMRHAMGLFGEKVNPIVLDDPGDPSDALDLLAARGVC